MKEPIGHPVGKKPLNWLTLIWLLLSWLLLFYFARGLLFPAPSTRTISYTEFKQIVKNGRITEATLKENEITGKLGKTPSDSDEEKAQKAKSAREKSIFQIFQKRNSQPLG